MEKGMVTAQLQNPPKHLKIAIFKLFGSNKASCTSLVEPLTPPA